MDNKISLAIILIIGVSGLSWAYLGRREIGIERAHGIAEMYLEALGDPDIATAEVMEFEYNHYVVYYEKSTGIGAFEMLIDKRSGRIFPEYGPNMMWNTNYGHRGMIGGFHQRARVNVFDGVVRYHDWHGEYIRSLEPH